MKGALRVIAALPVRQPKDSDGRDKPGHREVAPLGATVRC
jgi:hypothetical protein